MAGQLLGSRFALHDVEDVESFCGSIVQRVKFNLTAHEREELHVYLIETAWELSLITPRPWRTSFSGWVHQRLRLRCIDWQRSHYGRQRWAFRDRIYERPRVELVSLDADDAERDRLEASLSASSLDNGAHRLADELRLLDKRGRRPGGRNDWLGDEAA